MFRRRDISALRGNVLGPALILVNGLRGVCFRQLLSFSLRRLVFGFRGLLAGTVLQGLTGLIASAVKIGALGVAVCLLPRRVDRIRAMYREHAKLIQHDTANDDRRSDNTSNGQSPEAPASSSIRHFDPFDVCGMFPSA